MNEVALIVGEIILGIALLTVLTAVVTVWATRQLGKSAPARTILQHRYGRGDLTREQYEQLRQDFGIAGKAADGFQIPEANGRDVGVFPGTRQSK